MCMQVADHFAQHTVLLAQACILSCAIVRLVQHAMQKGPYLTLKRLGARVMMHTLVCTHACMCTEMKSQADMLPALYCFI